MFKPRQAPQSALPAAPPAIEVVRQRAKHRLIGAGVLVLAGVVVFPLLFDTQPRPIPVDIPIEIPSRQGVKSLGKATAAPADSLGADGSLSQREELVAAPVKAVPVPAEPKPAQELPAPPAQTPARQQQADVQLVGQHRGGAFGALGQADDEARAFARDIPGDSAREKGLTLRLTAYSEVRVSGLTGRKEAHRGQED